MKPQAELYLAKITTMQRNTAHAQPPRYPNKFIRSSPRSFVMVFPRLRYTGLTLREKRR